MANENKPKTTDPIAKRDFETGTVNPGPGMAPPHWADDVPAGSMTGAGDRTDAKTDQSAPGKEKKPADGGSCGCG